MEAPYVVTKARTYSCPHPYPSTPVSPEPPSSASYTLHLWKSICFSAVTDVHFKLCIEIYQGGITIRCLLYIVIAFNPHNSRRWVFLPFSREDWEIRTGVGREVCLSRFPSYRAVKPGLKFSFSSEPILFSLYCVSARASCREGII